MQARKYKKKKSRMSNAVIFLLTFLLFLVVFGGLCLWVVVKINEERRSVESSPSNFSSSEGSVGFSEDSIRNLLVITVDKGEAQGFVIVHANPVKSQMITMAFPRDTVVDYGTSEMKLNELYAAQGAAVTKTSLEKLMGLSFDNYAVITYPNIEKAVDYLEAGLIFMLPEDLEYQDEQTKIKIMGGLRTLSSSQVTSVLRYPTWHGGRKQQADIQAQIIAAAINQYMRPSRASKADADFSALVNLVKSDIMVSHYNAAKPGLDYLATRNTGNLCSVITLEGKYEGSGDALRFYAAENIKDLAQKTFGKTK